MSGSFSRIFGYKPLEFDMYISPDGITYYFNNITDKFSLGRVGDGLPPIEYITERGPFQAGETPLNYIVNSRLITLEHIRKSKSRDGYFDSRSELLDLLRPNRQNLNDFQPGVLRKILPDGSKRDILAFIETGLIFPTNQDKWDEYNVVEVIRFIAHDPFYYDPDENIIEYLIGTDADALLFPIEFPIFFKPDEGVEAFSIAYQGTWESFPIIILSGAMNKPKIKNITKNEIIYLDYNIPEGQSVTIDLTFGRKLVYDGLGNNLIGYISLDSDLINFSIVPEPIATNGENSIGVFAEETNANAKVTFRYFTRYIGI